MKRSSSPLARPDDEKHRQINDRALAANLRNNEALLAQMLADADAETRERLRRLGLTR